MSGDGRLRPARLWRPAWALLIVALGPPGVRAADGPVASPPAGQPPAAGSPGVLVMRNGRIVEGRLSQSAGGYLVELREGRMLVPFTQVQLQAEDRKAAYRKLRASMPQPTAENHVALARWCLTYELYNETKGELREALRLDPRSEAARTTLRRLEEILSPDDPEHKRRPQPAPRTFDGFEAPEARSLAGLSRELAEEYVVKVQPILMNGCAKASCHGPSAPNDFRLLRVHIRGGHRGLSEQNLATVLRYVDPQQPEQSPLLTVPRGSHGLRGRTIFRGRGGAEQIATLRRWVHQVAQTATGSDTAAGNDPAAAPAGATSKQAPAAVGRNRSPGPPPGHQLMPAMRAAREHLTRRDILTDLLRDERKDEFDPEAFNRAVHGEPRPTGPDRGSAAGEDRASPATRPESARFKPEPLERLPQ